MPDMEKLSAPPEAEEKPSASPGWGKWAWGLLLSALAASGCYFFCHFPYILQPFSHLPGIGCTLTHWMLTGAALGAAVAAGRLRVRGNPQGVFLLAVSLGLGACFTLFACDALRAMNLPVVTLSGALALFSLCGQNPLPALSAPGIRKGVCRLLPAFFRRFLMPLDALASFCRGRSFSRLRGLGLGLLLGLPAAGVALALLTSADAVYGACLGDAFASLRSLDGAAFVRLGLAALGCLALFSFLASTRDDPWADAPASPRSVNPVTLSTVLALLIAVYGLFVYVQFRYLFGGAETAKMAGGYAEYARSGFFQLVLLSALTLGLIMPFLQWGRDSRAVRLLCAVTILLTVVIVFSAFYRMRLYIRAYGLSILRIVTLWGMAMILLALTAALIKCIRPGLCVCPALAALALASWLALNLIGPETAVARNQVDLYNRGVIATLDAAYLSHLSPAAVKEMENIRDAAARDEALREAESYLRRAAPHAYDWSLPWLGVSADAQEH